MSNPTFLSSILKTTDIKFFVKIALSLEEFKKQNERKKILKFSEKIINYSIDRKTIYNNEDIKKFGYFESSKLTQSFLESLIKDMTLNPGKLVDDLLSKDIFLPFDILSFAMFSPQGKYLIKGENISEYPETKKIFNQVLEYKDFLISNKKIWLNSIKDKDIFLTNDNPVFYYQELLSTCTSGELFRLKKDIIKFAQDEDTLNDNKKIETIQRILSKINLHLIKNTDIEKILEDLPPEAITIYNSIKLINFSEEDKEILKEKNDFEQNLMQNKIPEIIIKYLTTNHDFSENAEYNHISKEKLINELKNIYNVKKKLKLITNEFKLSFLSIKKRYLDTITDSLKPCILFNIKSFNELKKSGELGAFFTDINEDDISSDIIKPQRIDRKLKK